MARLFIIFTCFLFFSIPLSICAAEENFLLLNGITKEVVSEFGTHIDEKVTPCSTFKIALCLMGFDSGILKDENTPCLPFQEGYDDFLESWKEPQNPQSWIKNSCVWYSKVLSQYLGLEKLKYYLNLLEYGNRDITGGLTQAWLSSSLKISPREQVHFIQKMVERKLPISSTATQMTKSFLFLEELSSGWRLYGKTGWSGRNDHFEMGWFVGWIEKNHMFFPFAYNIRDKKINLSQRIPRVKELLANLKLLTN